MKKLFKKLIAGISALTVMSMSVLPASALIVDMSDVGSYTVVNDNGMLDWVTYRENYEIIADSKGNTSLLDIVENKFRFSLKNDALTDEVKADVIEIISEYYPNNNYSDSYDAEREDYAEIITNVYGDYKIYINSVEDSDLEKTGKIKQALEEKGYISEFSELGYVAYQQPMRCLLEYHSKDISFETLEQYIIENQLNCTLKIYDRETDEYYRECDYYFNFADAITGLQMLEIAADIYKKYNVRSNCCIFEISTSVNGTYSTEQGETDFDIMPVAGDLDLDNDTGLADIVILSKYNSNAEIYPISDETARANADVNNDGEINSLDINILIEQLLGGFESAV